MKSRRLTDAPRIDDGTLAYGQIKVGVVRHSNIKRRMSALGQKRTLRLVRLMSALPPKADIDERGCHLRFVPIAAIGEGNLRPTYG
jgi:hypothetical protein